MFFRLDYLAIFNKGKTHGAGRPLILVCGFKVNSNKAIGETGQFQRCHYERILPLD